MPVDVTMTLQGINNLRVKMGDAMVAVVYDTMQTVENLAKLNTVMEFKYDYPEAKPPGTLRDSIRVQGLVSTGEGRYRGTVGTHLIYAGQREFGGPIYKKPENAWGMVFWYKLEFYNGIPVVYQQKYPTGRYMSPASRDTVPLVEGIVRKWMAPAMWGM